MDILHNKYFQPAFSENLKMTIMSTNVMVALYKLYSSTVDYSSAKMAFYQTNNISVYELIVKPANSADPDRSEGASLWSGYTPFASGHIETRRGQMAFR